MLDGRIVKNVPNWWNPYAPNLGQEDPQKKLRVIAMIKMVFAFFFMLAGAILALIINVIGYGKQPYVFLTCNDPEGPLQVNSMQPPKPSGVPTQKPEIPTNKTAPTKVTKPIEDDPNKERRRRKLNYAKSPFFHIPTIPENISDGSRNAGLFVPNNNLSFVHGSTNFSNLLN